MSEDVLGRTIVVGDRVAFPHSEYQTLVVGRVVKLTPKQCKIQCEVGHAFETPEQGNRTYKVPHHKGTPEITYRNHSNCVVVGEEE